MALIQVLGELLATANVPPSAVFPGFHTKGHRRHQRRGGDFALVVTQPGVAGFNLAVAHGVGYGKRRNNFARFE